MKLTSPICISFMDLLTLLKFRTNNVSTSLMAFTLDRE